MGVTMTGWARNHGPKTLCNRKFKPTDGPVRLRLSEATAFRPVNRNAEGSHDVTMVFGASGVALTGDYFGTVTLNETEVAVLFCMVLKGRPFSDAQNLLSQASKILVEEKTNNVSSVAA